jgi:hypothetical protein
VQGRLEEELDPAQGDREAGAGEVLDVDQVQKVLAKVLFAEPIGRPVEVTGELPDGVGVGFLGPCRQASELHILGHALAEWRHGVSFPGGGIGRPVQDAP